LVGKQGRRFTEAAVLAPDGLLVDCVAYLGSTARFVSDPLHAGDPVGKVGSLTRDSRAEPECEPGPALFAFSSPTSSSPALPSGKRLFEQNPNRV
jgi:hypothetical protein